MSTTSSSLLRNALYGNSVFSFLSGLACVFFSRAVASFLGLSATWIILVLGIGLILYGWLIYATARANPLKTNVATFAVYADLAWVLASAALIFANLVDFTTSGKWTIAVIADIVLVFAILQFVGLRRLNNRA